MHLFDQKLPYGVFPVLDFDIVPNFVLSFVFTFYEFQSAKQFSGICVPFFGYRVALSRLMGP